ncbi:unnamed protein product [Pleuronectes platessa]|uniref:Uncharacterized protein n=1 Tax=Pleuronectes platessa TaxID=8262 RepID=A0A9N7UFD8_PLEPL|nr:unnamed protein product [Pleuronectes platessa]
MHQIIKRRAPSGDAPGIRDRPVKKFHCCILQPGSHLFSSLHEYPLSLFNLIVIDSPCVVFAAGPPPSAAPERCRKTRGFDEPQCIFIGFRSALTRRRRRQTVFGSRRASDHIVNVDPAETRAEQL